MAVVGIESSLNLIVEVVALLGIIGCFYLQGKVNEFKKYGYLVSIISDCMKKSKPLGFIVDKSGVMIPFVIENDEEHTGLASNPGKYVLLAPDLVKPSARMEIHKGPKVLIYALPYFFPINLHSASALSQLAQKIHAHPRLSTFKNDVKVIELLFNNTGTFQEDCRTFVSASVGKVKLPSEYLPEEEEEDAEEYEEDPEEVEGEEEEEEEEESQFGVGKRE